MHTLEFISNTYSRKGRWSNLIEDFNFTIRSLKGSMHTIPNVLSHIREINMISFTEIVSNIYDRLRGVYPNDNYFAKH